MLRSSLFALLLLLTSQTAFAQIETQDSTAMDINSFMELVRQHHPMVLQAELIQMRAKAERLKASGAFDPKLFNETSQKYFDEKTYFQLQNAGVEIPAWYGLTAKAGYERNSGIFLNPQNNVPQAGLWYADVSLTVGRGFFIDQRRAMLQQSRLMQEAAVYEVEWALNNIYEMAIRDYWTWYQSYRIWRLYANAEELARRRLDIVRQNALIGEEPMIDTLEAYIQVQTRVLSKQKAEAEYNNARQTAETYLWMDGVVPMDLNINTYPVFDDSLATPLVEADWLERHPLLNYYGLKLEQLGVEQLLNKEALKPTVDLNYKFLNEPVQNQDFFSEYSPENYQWGVSASFPIFLRKERGEIQKTDVKIRDTEYERQLKSRELSNKIEALQLEQSLTYSQLVETEKMVTNYRGLLRAEIIKFENGESSLFLINQREIKYLESSEKLLELRAKLNQVNAKLLATSATLDDLLQ